MSGRLAGKVCLITGTAGGQGAAAAELFATEGATVPGCDIKFDVALFLASAEAAYLNAVDIVVDGGQSVIV